MYLFLCVLHALLAEADVVVTYNGDKFDMRHINREFLENGLSPPRPVASVDMLKQVKKHFNFPHNRLDYVCSVVLGERKLETGGFDLWPAFMEGEEKALKVMKRYNIRDVRLTEKLYLHMRPWLSSHPHIGDVKDLDMGDYDHSYSCEKCGSEDVDLERPRRTRCFAIRLLHCKKCGAWSDGKRKKL